MKKKHYLIENDRIIGGGSEVVMQQVIDKLVKEGHRVTLATYEGSRKECKSLFPYGVHFWRIAAYRRNNVKEFNLQWILQKTANAVCRIKKLILSKRGFDVAIAMKEGPCMLDISGVKAKRKYGWVHVDYRGMHWTQKMFHSIAEECQLFQKMDQVICVSKTAEDGIKATLGNPGNLIVAHNPVNVKRIIEKAKDTCPISRIENKFLIVAAGRLTWEKNFGLLLDACAILRNEEKYEVWILGDGPDRVQLQKIIDKNQLDFIKLLGNIANPYPYIHQADCFVSTSRTESYGLSVQEAMILGVPVIATDCPAMRETIPADYGTVISADAKMLAQEIRKLSCRNVTKLLPQYGCERKLYEDRVERIYRILESK